MSNPATTTPASPPNNPKCKRPMKLSCFAAAHFEGSLMGAIVGEALFPFSITKTFMANNSAKQKIVPKALLFSQLLASENSPGMLAKKTKNKNITSKIRSKFWMSSSRGISLDFNVVLTWLPNWETRSNTRFDRLSILVKGFSDFLLSSRDKPGSAKILSLKTIRTAPKITTNPKPKSSLLKTPKPVQAGKNDGAKLVPRKLRNAMIMPETSNEAEPSLNNVFLHLESA